MHTVPSCAWKKNILPTESTCVLNTKNRNKLLLKTLETIEKLKFKVVMDVAAVLNTFGWGTF